MRIAHPIAFLLTMALALALLHASSHVVFAQTECVQPLASVVVEGSWNSDCLSESRDNAYARYYTFTLTQQVEVTITLESEIDSYLFLLKESGEITAENDDIDRNSLNYNSRVTSTIRYYLSITSTLGPGDYTIAATTFDEFATGEFTLTVTGIGYLDDRATLTALYHATDGNNWTHSDNWLTGAPLSEWHGVTTDEGGRVAGLVLQYNALAGDMPSDISNLANLVTLDVSGNSLTGEIPPTLGSLSDLETLELVANSFTGSAPAELARLSKLRTLSLGLNDLTGEIPSEFGEFANLTSLHLSGNDLSGEIPSELGSLTNLLSLSLGYNQLTGAIPPELGELANLEHLSLGNNRLSGTIPPEIGNLSKLKDLSLRRNELTGGVPSWIGELSNLEALGLHVNNLTGEIPPEIGNLSKLDFLGLDYNYLTGEIPPEVGKLTELEGLGLDGNNLTGEVPAEIGNLTKLEGLYLSSNQLTGMLPQSLTRLTSLEEFYFDYNAGLCAPADDSFQNWMQGIGDLEGRTCGVPPTPSHKGDIAALTDLYNATDGAKWKRSRNWLTDASLSEWYGVRTDTDGRVTRLNLSDNNLSGILPAAVGNMASLKSLSISDNQLAGQLPSELTQLTNLKLLYFYSNPGICAPDDGAFQEWMQSVNNVQGPTCIDATPPDPLPNCVDQLPDDISVAGTWNIDCTSNITAPRGSGDRYARFYTFTLDTESDITITLSSDKDAFLYLRAGISTDGAALHENDDYNYPASTDSRIEETLEAGTYTIEATTYTAGVTGDFILTVNGVGPLDDLGALTALYNATDGDNWFNNTNWLTDAPLSEWHGVSTNDEGHVVSLNLGNNSLSGALPPETGGLINLSELGLGSNQLTGTVPSELGNLTRLEFLDLSYNRLWGELPRSMTALTRLISLYSLGNSGLCAPDDAEFQEWLEAIPSGSVRVITCNPPSTRPDAGDLAVLTALYNATDGANWDDNTNWLSEQPLQYWKGVTINSEGRVIQLDLFSNQLSGDIPVELGNLADLEWLYLHQNQLSGDIPAELGNLISLERLSLGGNQLSGDIPATLGGLTYLEVFDLSDNQLTGAIPPELASLTELWTLTLDRNQLSGDVPFELGNLISLKWLSLYNNQLTGDIPATLGRPTYLEMLDLSDNQLTGAIPPELANLTEMRSLHLGANQLTGEIPDWLGSLDQLAILALYDNQLTGAIPPELANLTELSSLSLGGNQLTGEIPDWLGRPTYLEVLDLSNNNLTGAIPPELGSLHQLFYLLLDNNQLTGTIPPELGSLRQLFYLLLDNNQLTGTIPPELGSLRQLGKLWLHNNRLTGTIPPDLSNLIPSLEELFLGGNQLTGCILKALRGVGTNDLDELGLPFCENADLEALIAFYNATDGDNWRDSANWLTAAPLSEWHGVSTNSEGRVVSLDLEYNSLSGAVPPEIGGLINLSHLYLGFNQLTGTLPPEVDNLTRLEVLTLTGNRLWGPLPDDMTALSVLHRFEFDYNSGLCASPEPGFQEWLQSIPLLRSGPTCVRTASPPDDRDIAALITLYNATDGANWLDSTNWLSDQPLQYWKGVHINEEGRIVELRLGGNNLSGQIPPELGNLSNLERLELYGNQLTGAIPFELGNLSKLERLSIQYNQLTSSIPSRLSNLIELTSLRLNGNRLTGAIPLKLSSLNNLQILLLDNNELTGAIPSELGNLSELVVLHLYNNQLTGTIPPELGSPPNLDELLLSNNQLTGCIPITLSLVPVTDFAQLGLPFCDNPDRAVLVALYHATNGDNWNNNSNWLTDAPLDEWYGVYTDNRWNVHELSLTANQLTGQLPPELGEFYAVKVLYFDNNQLTGHIPPELGNLSKNLVVLWLHSNRFAGTIPPELGNLDKLDGLNISDNQFTGELPAELTELRELYSLFFDNNAGLCAPTDADFQQWLQSIDIVEGPTCTDTTPTPTPEDPIPSECVNSLDSTPAEGTWTADCLSINRTENGLHYARYYIFSLDGRTTVELTLESRTDPYLLLLSEAGEILAQDDDDDEGAFDLTSRNSGIRIVLEAGDYIVEATTYAGTATGDFTLTFRRPELEALQSLYNFTNGDSWDNSENWLTDAPFAEWYGIQTDDEGRVIGIYLSDNNLKGEIPPELGRLSQLEWLGLANNELSGLIPPELGDLYSLRILVLFNNDLTGPIPYQFGKLQELFEMYLERNRLSGSIPTQLGDLRKLYFLNLTDNELSGSIPSSIGNLQELSDLHLAANDLSGPIPEEIGDLRKLRRLIIKDNDLTGGDFIAFRLNGLDDLSFLDIGGNRIDGRDVLFQVRELFRLSGLGMYDSGLTDSDLRDYMEIIRERDLSFFDISANELSDPQILEGLSRMSTLSYLHINDNDFSGELPQTMTGITDMQRFRFHDNDGLCAPTDDEFQDWLESIRDAKGDTCP